MYYKNVILFVQYYQSFVTFLDIAFVKANIAKSLQGSALEWYTLELSNFDHDILNNNSSLKSQVNALSHYFKVSTNMAFSFFINETYSLNNA